MTKNQKFYEGQYVLANGVIGFSNGMEKSTIRVKVLKVLGPNDVLVITASIRDAGTRLVLDPSQLEDIGDEANTKWVKAGPNEYGPPIY
jgi:hypothetical protein